MPVYEVEVRVMHTYRIKARSDTQAKEKARSLFRNSPHEPSEYETRKLSPSEASDGTPTDD